MPVSPLIFEPLYQPRIWGGDRLFAFLKRPRPPGPPIGESWEVADLENGQSVVARGPERGKQLQDLLKTWGRGLVGGAPLFQDRFPLLVKYLDARDVLSVQVHPSRAVAERQGSETRTKDEAWYILAAEPGAVIYHGLEPGIDAQRFRRAMRDGQVEGVLRRLPVRAGDCFFLPSGLPHALGAGILAAEVQTPSDTTYRTYDWGRVDPATGRPRELHLDAAVECIDFESPAPPPIQQRAHVASLWTAVTRLVSCPAFVIEHVRMVEGAQQAIPYAEMVVWILLEGTGEIGWGTGQRLSFARGDVVVLPARLPEPFVRITAGARWLEVTVPVASDLAGYEHPAPGRPSDTGQTFIPIGLPARRPEQTELS